MLLTIVCCSFTLCMLCFILFSSHEASNHWIFHFCLTDRLPNQILCKYFTQMPLFHRVIAPSISSINLTLGRPVGSFSTPELVWMHAVQKVRNKGLIFVYVVIGPFFQKTQFFHKILPLGGSTELILALSPSGVENDPIDRHNYQLPDNTSTKLKNYIEKTITGTNVPTKPEVKTPRWRPLNIKCVYLWLYTIYQRNPECYTYVFGVQLSNETIGNTVWPIRRKPEVENKDGGL